MGGTKRREGLGDPGKKKKRGGEGEVLASALKLRTRTSSIPQSLGGIFPHHMIRVTSVSEAH